MKKVLITVVLMFATFGFAQAQFKPQAGSLSTEVGLRLFSIGVAGNQFDDIMYGGIEPVELNNPININGIKVRYFISENIAVRMNLNFRMKTQKDVSENLDVTRTDKTTSMNFAIVPGAEYHFAGTERLSPYVGAEIGFGTGSFERNTNNAGYVDGNTYKFKAPHTTFNVGIVTGVDYYITKGLYLGAEFGFGFNTLTQKGSTVTTQTGDTTIETKNKDYSTYPSVGFTPNTAIRLGWKL